MIENGSVRVADDAMRPTPVSNAARHAAAELPDARRGPSASATTKYTIQCDGTPSGHFSPIWTRPATMSPAIFRTVYSRAAHVLAGLPAEDADVERQRRVLAAALQLVPAERARLVDELRALVLARLPDADDGAVGVDEDGHAAGLHDVDRRHRDLPAGLGRLRDGRVRVVDGEVRAPDGRLLLVLQRPDPRDELAVEREHPVPGSPRARRRRAPSRTGRRRRRSTCRRRPRRGRPTTGRLA